MEPNFTKAIARAEVRRSILRLLKTLALTEQQQVIADVVVLLSDCEEAADKLVASDDVQRDRVAHATPAGEINVGKVGARAKSILEALGRQPRIPVQELAQLIYGETNKINVSRVRAILWTLKHKGLLANTGTGKWEVISTIT
jgi:hypothetical protein